MKTTSFILLCLTLALLLFTQSARALFPPPPATNAVPPAFTVTYPLTNVFAGAGDQVNFSAAGQGFLSISNDKACQIWLGTNLAGELDLTGRVVWNCSGDFTYDGTNLAYTVSGSDNNTNDTELYVQGVITNNFTNGTVLQLLGLTDATNNAGLTLNQTNVTSTEQGTITPPPVYGLFTSVNTNTLYASGFGWAAVNGPYVWGGGSASAPGSWGNSNACNLWHTGAWALPGSSTNTAGTVTPQTMIYYVIPFAGAPYTNVLSQPQ